MLPKVELHVHLEGSIRPQMALILAKRHHLNFPYQYLNADQNSYRFKNFADFLHAFDLIASLIKSPQDYFDITYDYLKQSAEEGCIYCEMMYSPQHAELATHIPSSEHLNAIYAAIDKAYVDLGITGRIIITAVRHFGIQACETVAEYFLHYHHPYVVGFGLGGDELHYPPQLFKKTYAIAHDAGLHSTIHAGEFNCAASMLDAIKYCHAERIGHGVRILESAYVLDYIKDHQIPLEICPSSNTKLGLFPSIEQHPLAILIQHGLHISINSDDPPFMQTSIGREYQIAEDILNIPKSCLLQISQQAILDSFADQQTKKRVLKLFTKSSRH